MPTKRARLILADDHTLVAEGLRRLLEASFELVAVVEDGRALLRAVEEHKPDVVLLDVSMPLLNGFETARLLSKSHPEIGIVFVTMHADPEYMRQAFRAGGSAFVIKRSAASELITAIREVLNGRHYVTPLLAGQAFPHNSAHVARDRHAGLTTRQRQVLQLVAEGKLGKEIAAILHISPKTVEFHKASIMRELGLHSTAELTRYALQHGIVSP